MLKDRGDLNKHKQRIAKGGNTWATHFASQLKSGKYFPHFFETNGR